MLKSKAYSEYAKWWEYWMSKIPRSSLIVEHSAAPPIGGDMKAAVGNEENATAASDRGTTEP